MARGRVPGPLGLTPTSGRILSRRSPLGKKIYKSPNRPWVMATESPESPILAEMRENSKSEIALDIGQMILDITGILDPTPLSDGTNALLSLARGRWFDAAINAVSIVPYVGDLAKTAKLPHYLTTIRKAVRFAETDRKWAAALRELFLKLKKVLDKGYKLSADKLPDAAKRQLIALKKEVDDFLMPRGSARKSASKIDRSAAASDSGSHLGSSYDKSPYGVDSVAQSPSQLFGESAPPMGGTGGSLSKDIDNTRRPSLSQNQSPVSSKTPSKPDGESLKETDLKKNSDRSNKSDQSNNTNNTNSPNDPNKGNNKTSSNDVGPKTTTTQDKSRRIDRKDLDIYGQKSSEYLKVDDPDLVEDALSLKKRNPDFDVLTDDEFVALHAYTAQYYHDINPLLRSGRIKGTPWESISVTADSALEKLSKIDGRAHKGNAYRGIIDMDDSTVQNLFKKGESFSDHAFMSTSSKQNSAFSGNVRIEIKSKSGVKVHDASAFPDEAEVLFRPKTKFQVKDCYKTENGAWRVELEEL